MKYHTIDIKAPEWTGPHLRPCFFGSGSSEPNHPTDDLSRATLSGGAGWIYIASGRLIVREPHGSFELEEGQGLLYATPLQMSLVFPARLRRLHVAFNGNHSAETMEKVIRRFGSVHRLPGNSPPVKKARALFAGAQLRDSLPAHDWSVLMYDWMLALWRELERPGVCENPPRHFVRNSKLLGVLHPSFKSFSAAMGYHPAYLSRVIKKSWDNKSPAKLLRQGRMQEAEELLRTTNLSIREVSGIVRYASPESFAMAFRRVYRLSPLKYRHQHRLGSFGGGERKKRRRPGPRRQS